MNINLLKKLVANRKKAKARRVKRCLLIARYKRMKGCYICGYKENPHKLHFHHRDCIKTNKQISKLKFGNINKLKKEMSLCDIVCNIDHRHLHKSSF